MGSSVSTSWAGSVSDSTSSSPRGSVSDSPRSPHVNVADRWSTDLGALTPQHLRLKIASQPAPTTARTFAPSMERNRKDELFEFPLFVSPSPEFVPPTLLRSRT